MPFVTFIYKIGKRTYYGKYIFNCMSDDHDGLDDQIRPLVLDGINRFRDQKGLTPLHYVKIGILSFSVDDYIPCYSSDKEYYKTTKKLYVNGNEII